MPPTDRAASSGRSRGSTRARPNMEEVRAAKKRNRPDADAEDAGERSPSPEARAAHFAAGAESRKQSLRGQSPTFMKDRSDISPAKSRSCASNTSILSELASGNRIFNLELLYAQLFPHIRCPLCHIVDRRRRRDCGLGHIDARERGSKGRDCYRRERRRSGRAPSRAAHRVASRCARPRRR